MDEDRPKRNDEDIDRTDEDMIGQDVDDFEKLEELDEEEKRDEIEEP